MIKDITTEIQKFLQFLKSPKDRFSEPVTSNDRYRIFTVLFFAVMILNLLVIIPLLSFVNENIMKIEGSDLLRNFTIGGILFIGVVAAPVLEEFMFRFPLKYERNYVFRFLDKIAGRPLFSDFWKRNFPFIFYLTAILFGLVHSFNFKNEWNPLFLALLPFLVLSQSITGLFLGYIRLRLGFRWSILFHAFFNLVFLLVPYLMYHHTELINHKNRDYELRVVGLFCRDSSNTYLTYDKREGKIFMLEGTNIDLQFFLNSHLDKEYKVKDDELVHLYFKSEKGLTEQELVKVLKEKIEISE